MSSEREEREETLFDFNQRAHSAPILAVAQRLGGRLERVGASDEWTGGCPRCGGTGGFTIDARNRVFSCRTSAGRSTGGVVEMVKHVLALNSIEAAQWINEPPQAGER